MKIKSGKELNWATALKAAQALVKQCEDAHYIPPEALGQHTMRVKNVCAAMDTIVDALKLRAADGSTPTRVEPQ